MPERAGVKLRAVPLRQPAFRTFLAGHFVSLLGDQLYFLALPWTALRLGASPGEVGALLAAAAVPRAVLMLGGGVLADRFGGRRVMLGSDLLRAVVMTVAAVTAFGGVLGLPGLFALVLVFGAVEAVFQPALTTMLPNLLPPESLPAGNGLRTLALRFAQFVGPPASGALIGFGVGWVFAVNAATFLVSVLALRVVPVAPPAPAKERPRFTAELTAGLRYARDNRTLARLLLFTVLVNLGSAGPINVGLPLLAHATGWEVGGLALMMGALGAGATVGAALLGFGLLPGAGTGFLLIVMSAGQAALSVVVGLTLPLPVVVATLAGLGFFLTVAGSSAMSLVQAITERPMLGRVGSLMSFAVVGLLPVTYAVCGSAAGWIGVRPVLLAGGAIQVVTVVWGLFSAPLRQVSVTSGTAPSGDKTR
ncbi:MFS transporter [Actinoplanes cyaneus]|uniref:MFS transporter n=1 Tax=Actinoplanes cyaneus TaxID=52696 RepID=UPI0019425F7C|nr:MFS transporter [Actinoplanes cyaneus]MCW2142239.1 putative arabinose efflux permease, MFS family [Actinoplanes cyaneus]